MAASQDLEVGTLRPEERAALERTLAQALHFEPPRMAYWIDGIGAAHFRVVRAGACPVGGLAVLRMGQWFGGSRVPVAGISSVGIAPEWRGRGAASALLRGVLAELHATGVALATLYPSTLPVYRKAGFERAGSNVVYDLALANVNLRAALDLAPVTPDDWGTLAAIREPWARRQNGAFDRAPFMWQKILAPFGQEAFAYQIVRGDRPEGYVVYAQGGRDAPLQVLDWCARSRDAALTLLAFLAGDRAMITTATLRGAPEESLLYLLPERSATISRAQTWMLRIVAVVGALRARGYPPALTAELHLAVVDDLLPANSGLFVLRVAGGRGAVERGGAGRLRLDVRALASLYTGYLTAEQLAAIGALDGPAEDLALAGLVFAGARPWLGDNL
jgi:predicted acetyltransferase